MASFIREATLPLAEGPALNYKGQSIATISSTIERLRAKARRLVRARYASIARPLRNSGASAQAGDALLEISAYTIRHTVATELRRRGVPEWEAAGMLGPRPATRRPNALRGIAPKQGRHGLRKSALARRHPLHHPSSIRSITIRCESDLTESDALVSAEVLMT